MEIKGKITQALDMQTGEGKNGTWSKQEYIIETLDSKYPKSICVAVWGDKIEQFGLKVGDTTTLSIEVESREFNSKWYTNVQAWRSVKEGAQESSSEELAPTNEDLSDDLPF